VSRQPAEGCRGVVRDDSVPFVKRRETAGERAAAREERHDDPCVNAGQPIVIDADAPDDVVGDVIDQHAMPYLERLTSLQFVL